MGGFKFVRGGEGEGKGGVWVYLSLEAKNKRQKFASSLMIILLLFLQKQNLAFAVYLFGSVLSSKRLFRGPSTNDMKK